MSKAEQMEANLRKLSQAELRQWLDEMLENKLDFTQEFERSILQAERDVAEGKSG